MATINGYTAERMKEIEDSAIVDGYVSGDNLILKRFDNGEINAGSVRGPQGYPGISDFEPYLLDVCPTGVILPYGGTIAPNANWGICNGASLVRSEKQALFDIIGTAFGAVDGSHFNLPDLRQRLPLGKADAAPGNVLGGSGGSKDLIVVTHTHPIDTQGSHGHTAGAAGGHNHTNQGESAVFAVSIGGPQNDRLHDHEDAGANGAFITYTSVGSVGNHQHGTDTQGSHNHTATYTGSSGTNANLPPYLVLNFIIRY